MNKETNTCLVITGSSTSLLAPAPCVGMPSDSPGFGAEPPIDMIWLRSASVTEPAVKRLRTASSSGRVK